MPPFELTFGSLDLAPYLRIGNDEGFDPYDSGGFEEPAFIDNPFGEGQGLANVDTRNREMSWPLYLNAASKDALHALVRQINQEIRYAARPLRVRWKDQDASNSTYYDVEFARFDANFRVRPSAQRWLAGTLRVWCKPYGHTATERVVGTAVGSSHLVPVTIASRAGDIDSQVVVNANMPTGAQGISGYTILPHPSYVAARNASLIERYVTSVGTVVGASGGVASMYLGLFVTATDSNLQQAGINLVLSPATVYAGRHRVMAVMRSRLGRGFAVNRLDAYGEYSNGYGPTQVGSAADWHLFDLGVITVPSHLSYATYNTAWIFGGLGSQTITASPAVQITELLVVPEESTHLLTSNTGGGPSMMFDGVNARSLVLSPQFYDRTAYANGYPGVPPGGSYRVAAISAPGAGMANPYSKSLAAVVSTRERFTFAR